VSSPDNRPDLRVDATEDTNRVSPISVVAEAASDAERSAQVDTVVHDSACEGASLDPVVSRLRRPRLPADNTPTEHNARKTLHREACALGSVSPPCARSSFCQWWAWPSGQLPDT